MDVFLLLAVIAVGASGLFVAATLNGRTRQTTEPLIKEAVVQISGKIDKALTERLKELRTGLVRELVERERQRAQVQSEQIDGLVSDMKRQAQANVAQIRAELEAQGAQTQAQIDQIGSRIADVVSRTTTTEPGKPEPASAGSSAAEISPGEITMTQVTDPSHRLTVAVLEAESSCELEGWGNPPQLFALAVKAKLIDDNPDLAAEIRAAPEDALISVKQPPLPAGEPGAVLAGIYWPDDVSGCVLVAETLVLPQKAREEAPHDPAAVEQWAKNQPGAGSARLAVGVTRDGQYTCLLRRQGENSVQLDPELADDLVTALLETF